MKRIVCLFIAQLLAGVTALGFTPPSNLGLAGRPASESVGAAARVSASGPAAAQDDEPSDEECAKKAKEFVENMKDVERALDPMEEAINAQMGSSGPRLDVPRWRSVFTKTRGRTQMMLASRGVFLSNKGDDDTNGILSFIKDSFLELVGTLEWWDQDTETVWKEDLLAGNLVGGDTPEEREAAAKKEAEAMGDRRLHWYMENDLLRMKIAEWYHNYELVQDQRQCLARQHRKRRDNRPSSIGQDFRTQSTSRMRPNDSFHRGAPGCDFIQWEEPLYNEKGEWIGITVIGKYVCH